MNIGIIGTRGIPNNYGGFEQFAEYLSIGLQKRGHQVNVYNPHNHPYQQKKWKGVNIIHKFDPEYKIGTAGQFIYDFNCIADCRSRNYDVILQLGYTSSSVWGWILPKHALIMTNMDGLEWKRSKYSVKVRGFLKFAEKLAVQTSNYLIADSIGIQSYLYKTYHIDSVFIPYGATVFENPDHAILNKFKLDAYKYNMLIARLEPENSIEIILEGVTNADTSFPMLIIGNYKSSYGTYLINKFSQHKNIYFLGTIYDLSTLNNLRYFSNLYFHGHTVGGTNPSLLEAIASQAVICAHDNEFNKAILGEDAYYFSSASHITDILSKYTHSTHSQIIIKNNLEKIKLIYSWEKIIDSYENFMIEKLNFISHDLR